MYTCIACEFKGHERYCRGRSGVHVFQAIKLVYLGLVSIPFPCRPPVHPPCACPGPGSILVLNTIEAFKTADKKKLLEDSARQVNHLHGVHGM